MILSINPEPLPRVWATHPQIKGLVAETDIGVSRTARLKAKVLIFKKPSDLRHFWRVVLKKGDLGNGCLGCVQSMGIIASRPQEQGPDIDERWIADPRYFCIIGLIQGHLTMEIITHESVHAGFAYAARQQRRQWVRAHGDLDEEQVCYPAGAIAASINRFIHKKKLYDTN